ncbi:hypothetical protein TWF970_010626 [Orbilia oligospora]|uniref:SGNH hydrolase-type esterase domain-containing protein n=1 Tax=Orbilia oligospora TaxID=2813651 RepID=A0A7C8VTI7_ORBOL|nr:hypothetical protein TWF970_010626 [Orbilia oligospora]
MRFIPAFLACLSLATATILENGQARLNPYPGQAVKIPNIADNDPTWKTYPPDAHQISYKGRWCSKYISWWSSPGINFRYAGDDVAITFGEHTSNGVLLAWRISGQPWNFANVTAGDTYQFINKDTPGQKTAVDGQQNTFEFRVTNWALGVQLKRVHVTKGTRIYGIPEFHRKIEMIGDSLTAGYTATYEGISSFAWGLCEGLGNVEFTFTAYSGICLTDKLCWGNPRGQLYQWLQTSDTGFRAQQIYGTNPEPWPFNKHQKADIVVINLGTNDSNQGTETGRVPDAEFQANYIKLIASIHEKYPRAQVIAMQIWQGFYSYGNTHLQNLDGYQAGILAAVDSFKKKDGSNFVHYFNTTGILQHNDINPLWHPTDTGHIKVAAHLMQFIKLKFNWELGNTGKEVYSHTTYWNDLPDY